MERRELGRSGISVTRVILGCGGFGGVGSLPSLFGQGVPKGEAFRIMDEAWELGIRTFDTADAYGGGRSESWIGDWIREKGSEVRDALVVETKTFNPMDEGADHGLSRGRIHRQVETSLARLGLERIPLYMAHDFDPATPLEETLRAFDELVRAGTVGAIGVSGLHAERLAEAVEISELEGLARYEWTQESYSLLDRRAEETLHPVCREHGLGYEAFGPLAGGWLAGLYRPGEPYPTGSRMALRPEAAAHYATAAVFAALERFGSEARERGVSMAGLALAWVLASPSVTAVLVGPERTEHLGCVREALELELTHDEVVHLRGLFE